MSLILEGNSIRDAIGVSLKKKIIKIVEDGNPIPTLVVIQVGNDDASNLYIGKKKEFGQSIGVNVIHKKFNEDISSSEIKAEINSFNEEKNVHGILVQLPLPKHLNQLEILECVDPFKDADGLHPKSRAHNFWPATTKGILTLLDYYKIKVGGKNVLVVGSSYLVGVPTALALIDHNATVTVANDKTLDLEWHCLQSDIIVSAVGQPDLITKNMLKKGQIVIDIGITNINGVIKGDVDFESAKEIVEAITPVPGGVGSLTVASLFENLMELYDKKA